MPGRVGFTQIGLPIRLWLHFLSKLFDYRHDLFASEQRAMMLTTEVSLLCVRLEGDRY